MTNSTRVCVVYPRELPYSETFIRAHIDRLPGAVVPLRYDSVYTDWTNSPALPLASLHPFTGWCTKLAKAFPRFKTRILTRFLLQNRVDVVLAEFGTTAIDISWSCRQAGIPLVTHFHGFDAFREDVLEEYADFYKLVFEAPGAVISVSEEMTAQLLRLGVPREKLFINPCGVDESLFAGGNPKDSPQTFLSVGRFVDKKGPILSLLAFEKVARHLPDARLVMVGDGPLMEPVRQMVLSLGLTQRVQLTGVLQHNEVAELMRESRALVQHSIRTKYGDREGTPVCVLEAGASRLPVVATRHGGIPEAVIDGETGLLCDEGDTDRMAEHMIRLARQPGLAQRLGLAAREHILKNYSMDKSIDRLYSIIETALNSGDEPRLELDQAKRPALVSAR